MTENRKIITPNQLELITSLSSSDVFIVYKNNKYYSLSYERLQELIGSTNSKISKITNINSDYTILSTDEVVFVNADVVVTVTLPPATIVGQNLTVLNASSNNVNLTPGEGNEIVGIGSSSLPIPGPGGGINLICTAENYWAGK